MHTRFLALSAASLLMAGCTSMDAPLSADMTPEDRAGYVTMASSSDLFEIQSSQMALSKAQRPEVREFAQMLVAHHTQTTSTLMQAAQAMAGALFLDE